MVQDSGKKVRVDTLKPVNLPEPVDVEEIPSGEPAVITVSPFGKGGLRGISRQTVTSIDDRWRIDDEWWRSEPVSRMYYAVRLASGQRLVIYKDLVSGQWYKQTY